MKWLGFLALTLYILAAVAFIALRYWVMPNIERWREPLQRELSALLEDQVELGSIRASLHWQGPRITLGDARVRDEHGRLLMRIPTLHVALAWPELLSGEARFLSLRADGVDIAFRRDTQDRVSLLGYQIEGDDEREAEAVSDIEMLYWLSRQGDLQLTNARVRWIDESRAAPPLVFTQVSLVLGARNGDLLLTMAARPPAALGRSFALQGSMRIREQVGSALLLSQLSGSFHVHVDGMRPAMWQPWLDVHSALIEGEVSWRGWQEIVDGVPGRHVSDVTVDGGRWNPDGGVPVAAQALRLYLAGTWTSLQRLWKPQDTSGQSRPPSEPVRVAMRLNGLVVEAPEVLTTPLHFDAIAVSGSLARDELFGLTVEADRLQVRNADMDLDVNGRWQELGAGTAGHIDMNGRFERAELAAIVRYLPVVVDEDARAWMRNGLLAGRLTEAPVRLQGDLAHFPFGEQQDKGDFAVGGPVQDVVIDYAPEAVVGPPGWPRLERLKGHASLHRVDLRVRADSMQMRPGDHVIQFSDVDARIANIEDNPVLEVQGRGRAPAAAVLALVRQSPLGAMLDSAFEQASGEGAWQVPLALTIPLSGDKPIAVAGAIELQKASLSFAPTLPSFSDLNGRISFTEEVLNADGLKGRFLGEAINVSGGMGRGEKGLVFEGRLTASALSQVLGERFNEFFEGATAYRLAIQRTVAGAYDLRLEAPLEGMAINAPAPLGKAAELRRPLLLHWADPRKGSATLTADLGGGLTARFLHREGSKEGPFFHTGLILLKGSAKAADGGLTIDIATPRVDVDAWRDMAAAFEGEDGGAPILPPLHSLRLETESATVLGTDLDKLTFTMRRAEGQRWRVDVSSTQTAGTLFWRERKGGKQGEVEAKFERLALGAASTESPQAAEPEHSTTTLEQLQREIDIPAIRVQVDRLKLYGRDVGALSVVGVNEAKGRSWTLQELKLSSPHGALQGNGTWRLEGAQRGLRVQAEARFQDLGAWLDMAGFKALMQGGKGQVRGHVEWRDVPWRFERSMLDGELEVDLAEGRFNSVGSLSARLLELLSLQSVRRLATLDWKPAGLLKQGFPYDTLQGRISLTEGVMHSENYRVTGPVATIVIAGDVDLPRERLDLYAVVVPNLDVSGAAIAAGIAVNPIVGLGAFLTQWLLKAPLSKAMAVEYRVKGAFDAPEVTEISTRGGNGAESREETVRER